MWAEETEAFCFPIINKPSPDWIQLVLNKPVPVLHVQDFSTRTSGQHMYFKCYQPSEKHNTFKTSQFINFFSIPESWASSFHLAQAISWWNEFSVSRAGPLRKKATIHHVTTMLDTSKNVLFPGHDHLLTISADNPSLAGARVIIKVSGHQQRWLAGGYDLEIGHF